MSNIICGAMTKARTPCNRLVEAAGKRCRLHGGHNTGPRSLTARLRNGATLKLYRVNGAPKGHRKTDKARLRREARARRAARLPAMIERQRRRALRWEAKKRLRAGLPLLTEVEIENFGADPENKD